jgi:regulatory protein
MSEQQDFAAWLSDQQESASEARARKVAELRAELAMQLHGPAAQPRVWRGERGPAVEDQAAPEKRALGDRGKRERCDPATRAPQDQSDPAAWARDICLQLLTARPRTRDELKKALLRKEIDAELAEQVLGRLDDVGLIDDKAFAEMWVRSRHTYRGMGPRALAVELRRRGVDNDVTAEAVAMVDSDAEEDRARQLVRKRLPSMSSADQQAKIRRLVGMLARKGYSQGLAYRVVKEELANQGEETDLLDIPD